MKPIIVATDFSMASHNAANYAADMATAMHADIILLHVIQVPATTFQVPMTEFEFDEIENSAHISLESLQKQLMLRTNNKINIYAEIQYGTVEIELQKMSYEKKPFAIVMGIKNNGAAKRFFVGSSTLRLIHDAYYPLLVIPEQASFKGIKSISIASDLVNVNENTSIQFIKEWLDAFHASPDFIYVNTGHGPENSIGGGIISLQNSFEGFNPEFHFIQKDKIEDGINSFIEEHKTDLLIVMPEKHGFLESLLQASYSKQIILHSHLPVLSVVMQESPSTDRKNEKTTGHHHSDTCIACNGKCANKKDTKEKHIDETHPLA